MKLKTVQRAAKSKGEVNALRREGNIPCVLYIRGKEGETLAIKSTEFNSYLRGIKPGHLPTTIFTLVDDKGNERQALVKDIHYAITSYDVLHLDFEELIEDHQLNVKIPIECTGVADCAGIKLGGVLRQVIRHVRVRCLPKDIPSQFEVDIRELSLKQSKRLSDIDMPQTVRPLVPLNEVAVVIVKR